uniref:Uncharacterized protein n=1 Tax=Vespula pensylvanica TaxID=30213 RepID=A0A834UAB9_VESPE|nr:hypothetical protein H0235_008016 [Vespula pensylvanica]
MISKLGAFSYDRRLTKVRAYGPKNRRLRKPYFFLGKILIETTKQGKTNTRMQQCENLLGEDPFFMTKLVSNSVPHFITIPAACSEAGHPEIYSKLV